MADSTEHTRHSTDSLPESHAELQLHDQLQGTFAGSTAQSLASLGVEIFSAGELEKEIYRKADESFANIEIFGHRKVKELDAARTKLQTEVTKLQHLVDSNSTTLDESDVAELKQAIVAKRKQHDKLGIEYVKLIDSLKKRQQERTKLAEAVVADASQAAKSRAPSTAQPAPNTPKPTGVAGVLQLDDMIRQQAVEMAALTTSGRSAPAKPSLRGQRPTRGQPAVQRTAATPKKPVSTKPAAESAEEAWKPTPANRPVRGVVRRQRDAAARSGEIATTTTTTTSSSPRATTTTTTTSTAAAPKRRKLAEASRASQSEEHKLIQTADGEEMDVDVVADEDAVVEVEETAEKSRRRRGQKRKDRDESFDQIDAAENEVVNVDTEDDEEDKDFDLDRSDRDDVDAEALDEEILAQQDEDLFGEEEDDRKDKIQGLYADFNEEDEVLAKPGRRENPLETDDFDDQVWAQRKLDIEIEEQTRIEESKRRRKEAGEEDEESAAAEFVTIEGDLVLNADLHERLFEHQRVCVRWLWELNKQECGGIVGDEMGLGKTAEVIAFFQSLLDSNLLLEAPDPANDEVSAEEIKNSDDEEDGHPGGSQFASIYADDGLGADEDNDDLDIGTPLAQRKAKAPRVRLRVVPPAQPKPTPPRVKRRIPMPPRPTKRGQPILVVCPATVMRQWVREFHTWAPKFRVLLYHTSNAKTGGYRSRQERETSETTASAETERAMGRIVAKAVSDAQCPTVVITTYEMVRSQVEKLVLGKGTPEWRYVVLDEGHKLRNPNAAISTVCKQFATVHRILLTGAPIQNNLIELWSLFDFVFPGKLGNLETFSGQFAHPIVRGGYANATPLEARMAYKCAVALRDLIKPYLLRRLKKDVEINLPSKNEQVLFCQLTAAQKQAYQDFLHSKDAKLVFAGKKNLLYGIDILRKICNHPMLLKPETGETISALLAGKPGSEEFAMTADEIAEKSVKLNILRHVLASWKAEGEKVLIFSQTRQMLDIIEYIVRYLQYTYLRLDGSTSVGKRASLISAFETSSASENFLFLLTTRVGGLGISLTSASKVLIFDPDWNPVTDSQARERSYRIGQDKPVTVYRLITSGTVEEKIYHRQIFKQFLTNRVLTDPRQSRALFRSRDLKELFRLEEEGKDSEHATETHRLVHEADEDEEPAPKTPKTAVTKKKRNSGDAEVEDDLLEGLVGSALHSRISHDAVTGENSEGRMHDIDHLYEKEAAKMAKTAVERLKNSRGLMYSNPSPTTSWAGAGRFGTVTTNRAALPSAVATTSAAVVTPAASSNNEGSLAFAATTAGFSNVNPKFGQVAAPASSAALLKAARRNVAPTQRITVNDQDRLANDLVDFLQDRHGAATSEEIIEHFKPRIQQDKSNLIVIKSMLKQLASFNKYSQAWELTQE